MASPTPHGQAQDPTAAAVQSTNALGLALYRELARAKAGENLFLSPFSLTSALAMVAEGARAETAAELATALQLPEGGGLLPVHAGIADLMRRFQTGGGDERPELAARIDTLRAQLDAGNRRVADLERTGAWAEAGKAADAAEHLANELNGLLVQVGRYELRVGNALWTAHQLQLVPAFLATLGQHYGTEGAIPVDFAADPEAARKRINAWVAGKTDDRIQDLIPGGGIGADTALVITNAVWFRGEWVEPFAADRTRDEDFQLAGGGSERVRLMHDARIAGYAAFHGNGKPFATPREVPADPRQRPPATYPGVDGFTLLELPYKGGELSLVALAPRSPAGLERLEAQLTPATLTRWLGEVRSRRVDIGLLRFEQRSAFDAAAALQALGIRRAFADPRTAHGAQFEGICATTDPQRQLRIAAVQHEACIEVTEKGTEAAAATAVMAVCAAAMPTVQTVPFVPVFRTDRPFVYLIRDVRSGAILFLGRMLDPRD